MMNPNMNFFPLKRCRAKGYAQKHAENGAKKPLISTTCSVFKIYFQYAPTIE